MIDYINACRPSDAEVYCAGCWQHFDAYECPPDVDDPIVWNDARRDAHEAACSAWQVHRVMESLRFFARLDAVRAPGSW